MGRFPAGNILTIAVIAGGAIVIASFVLLILIQSPMKYHEQCAEYAMKKIAEQERLFRSQDFDRNGIQDYWTGDVSGLYRVLNADEKEIQLIDVAIARADKAPLPPVMGYVGAQLTEPAAWNGYYFRAMTTDEIGSSYRINALAGTTIRALHTAKFAFCAYPEKYDSTGKNIFLICQDGNLIKKETGNHTPVMTWPDFTPRRHFGGPMD